MGSIYLVALWAFENCFIGSQHGGPVSLALGGLLSVTLVPSTVTHVHSMLGGVSCLASVLCLGR